MAFLDYFYSKDSETKGNAQKSALRAGYSESVALTKATRIIKRFGDASAGASLNAVGVNKPYLASRLKSVLENGDDKEILAAARLAYTLLGETTGDGGAATNVYNAPVMIIQGMTQSRMKALREAIPQLTAEEKQLADEQESADRLAAFKRGELGFVSKHSKADPEGGYNHVQEAEVLDLHPNDAQPPREAEPQAG
jgi:hypothetical protein